MTHVVQAPACGPHCAPLQADALIHRDTYVLQEKEEIQREFAVMIAGALTHSDTMLRKRAWQGVGSCIGQQTFSKNFNGIKG